MALEELQAALEVVPAATAPQPRLLVALEELVAALGGCMGAAPPPLHHRLKLLPLPQLRRTAPLLLLAPQAASSRKAGRAVAGPLTRI